MEGRGVKGYEKEYVMSVCRYLVISMRLSSESSRDATTTMDGRAVSDCRRAGECIRNEGRRERI